MHAVIFDIDGTLLRSSEIDGKLYVAAVRAVLGGAKIRGSWGDYCNVSDSGILVEILKDNAIEPGDARANLVRQRFVESVAKHISHNGPFEEIPGARDYVLSLVASENHAVAYATGGWSASAALKLISSGFPLQNIPLATSDNHPERTAIMRHALDQLGHDFESVTYYGDGAWDRVAAMQLRWHFVPVGESLSGLKEFKTASA